MKKIETRIANLEKKMTNITLPLVYRKHFEDADTAIQRTMRENNITAPREKLFPYCVWLHKTDGSCCK